MAVVESQVEVVVDDLTDVEFIATGGAGTVYRAVQVSLGRVVALKVLHAVDLRDVRIQREARVQALMSSHANVVTLFGMTTVNGTTPALIMEYVPGGSLQDRISRSGPLTVDEWMRVGAEVASAIAAAHDLGIVHRDVKPSNILFAADGSARLGDFGISGTGTRTIEQLEASVAFAAPEILEGDRPSPANDVFSLVLTILVAAVGRHPFGDGVAVAAMAARIQSEQIRFSDWVPDLPEHLGAALDRCLDLEPDERLTAAELVELLSERGEVRPVVQTEAAPTSRAESLSVRGLCLVDDRFGFEQRLLDSVSFGASPGEVVALVGQSKSGVRLALEVAGGVRSSTSGLIAVGGGSDESSTSKARGWAYVAPDPQVFPTLTVAENLRYFAGLVGDGRSEVRMRVARALEAMMLRELRGVRADRLSTLNAHRLHLAVAMVSNPAVVLIDWVDLRGEPVVRSELGRSLSAMTRSHLAVVVGTSESRLASQVADRFVVMSSGRVVAQGSSDSLMMAYGGRDATVILTRESAHLLLASCDSVHSVCDLDERYVRLSLRIETSDTVESLLGEWPREARRDVVSIEIETPEIEVVIDRLLLGQPQRVHVRTGRSEP